MTQDLVQPAAPDLRRIYASAPRQRGRSGDTLPDQRVVRPDITLDVSDLGDYARLTGFTLGSQAPVTYPHMVVSPLQMVLMSEKRFPLPMMGLVHLVNRIRQHRPIEVGETMTAVVTAADLRPHSRGRQVDLVSAITVDGEPVWESVSTYLSRGSGGRGDAVVDEAPDASDVTALSTGSIWRLGGDTGRRYARVSGDWNPIHLHALTARPLGFPTAIAHGMYTYARAMADISSRVGTRGLSSTVWFAKPVRLPGTVLQRTVVNGEAHGNGRSLTVLYDRRGDLQHAVIENTW